MESCFSFENKAGVLSIFLSFLAILVPITSYANSLAISKEVNGALCLIRADDKLLLVNEKVTKRLSLPGGLIDAGEEPFRAAEREAWEEAGLVVTAVKKLGYTDTAVIYDCQSDSEIVAFQFENPAGGSVLPVWFAPHYGIETNSAMLISPDKMTSEQYRFPEQWQGITALYLGATNQASVYVDDLKLAAPIIHQHELNGLLWLKLQLESLAPFFEQSLLQGDVLVQPWALVLLLPVLLSCAKKAVFNRFIFTLITTTLLILVARQGFSYAPPYAYIPQLQSFNDVGFSFPNLALGLWVSSIMVFKQAIYPRYYRKYHMVSGFIIVWILIAQYYAGMAFLSDGIVGGVIGYLVVWHLQRLENKKSLDVDILISAKSTWLALSAITLALFCIFWQVVFAQLFAVCALLTLRLFIPKKWLSGERKLSFKSAFIGLLLIIVFSSLDKLHLTYSYSSYYSAMIEVARYPALLIAMMLFFIPFRKSK
ncbi:hypothetical protein BCU68_11445 [Vibrio sp. 10N.286.49.B3]|uniref:NUDIX domain-containing protein n=1 Tax=Vibrio sp. 10N.286.49.B3 TaxID=1880855 RepID=UPI000CBF9661|nr:NUDIX domain-containing protein [Vibrio sp. 10N.286.49.B3]PMH44916.1 hypothetical protein BCU68_11445 [Vibrio sp. 10N.286.49.B3]